MTKQEILDNFNDINFVYNDSSRYETLSRMLDELLKEQEAVVRCKDCKHYRYYGLTYDTVSECTISHCENPDKDWFCAGGER